MMRKECLILGLVMSAPVYGNDLWAGQSSPIISPTAPQGGMQQTPQVVMPQVPDIESMTGLPSSQKSAPVDITRPNFLTDPNGSKAAKARQEKMERLYRQQQYELQQQRELMEEQLKEQKRQNEELRQIQNSNGWY